MMYRLNSKITLPIAVLVSLTVAACNGGSNPVTPGVSNKTADNIAACSAGISVESKATLEANVAQILQGVGSLSVQAKAEIRGIFLNSGFVKEDNALAAYKLFIGCMDRRL